MLNASIVLYKHIVSEIAPLIETLKKAGVVSEIFLLDNSPKPTLEFDSLPVTYIFNHINLGYGAAHNIAIRHTIEQNIPYHLVINPDIAFDPGILDEIVGFMNNHSEIGLLMPKIYYPNGEIQYLCKLLPTPFDLIFRRFVPRSWTQKRMERFEMRASGYNRIMDVPYLSGCFMFLRTKALKEVGLFDKRFFMYPEDIDLTRRIHRQFRTVFYPEVSIIHHHAQSSYLNFNMLLVHTLNMIKYFNKWGWIFDSERRKVNKEITKQY
jgi:hypothetical protein